MNDYLLRIKRLMEEKRISEAAFAREIGVNQRTINSLFRRNSIPKMDLLHRIHTAFAVNPLWLLTGEGSMSRSKEFEDEDDFPDDPEQLAAMLDYLLDLLVKKGVIEESDIPSPLPGVRRVNYADKMSEETYRMLQRQLAKAQQEAERVQREIGRIEEEMKRYEARYSEPDEVSEPEEEYGSHERLPLYEVVAAGEPLESFDAGETYSVPLSRLHGNPKRYFAVRIRGESMTEAGIYDDSIAVIRRELDLINGQIYLFRHEGEYTLKRYRLGDDMRPRLLYEDGTGREIEMHEGEEWETIGVFCFVG